MHITTLPAAVLVQSLSCLVGQVDDIDFAEVIAKRQVLAIG